MVMMNIVKLALFILTVINIWMKPTNITKLILMIVFVQEVSSQHDFLFFLILSSKVCGGLAGAAARAEGLGSSNQLQGSKSETFAMLGAVSG